jgi:hypothetical protein
VVEYARGRRVLDGVTSCSGPGVGGHRGAERRGKHCSRIWSASGDRTAVRCGSRPPPRRGPERARPLPGRSAGFVFQRAALLPYLTVRKRRPGARGPSRGRAAGARRGSRARMDGAGPLGDRRADGRRSARPSGSRYCARQEPTARARRRATADRRGGGSHCRSAPPRSPTGPWPRDPRRLCVTRCERARCPGGAVVRGFAPRWRGRVASALSSGPAALEAELRRAEVSATPSRPFGPTGAS